MRNGAGAIEVGEPGAPDRALAQNAGHGRRLNDCGRQSALGIVRLTSWECANR
jgi:hypothetical protein